MRRILLILLAATAVHAEDFEKKYQQFRKYIGRPSLRKRVEGLQALNLFWCSVEFMTV